MYYATAPLYGDPKNHIKDEYLVALRKDLTEDESEKEYAL
jgi:hypothetical protein